MARPTSLNGFGLFRGLDVNIELLPAPAHHGIVFERTDLQDPVRIPAVIDHVVDVPRRTVLASGAVRVETIEHLMAALSALRVDNCLVRIDAPEVPTLDGSARPFVEAIGAAGIEEQTELRTFLVVDDTYLVTDGTHVGIAAQPPVREEFRFGYVLDYGRGPIPRQSLSVAVTPESFSEEIAFARTFALESEVRQLQAGGEGLRATAQDVVVIGEQGVIGNSLRAGDECVRHKILDCIGDFALAGCDLHGRFTAVKSGHRLNHELIRQLVASIPKVEPSPVDLLVTGASGGVPSSSRIQRAVG